jgi:hypothetical protein
LSVSVVDVLGRELAEVRLVGSPTASIDLPPGQPGFYTLIVKDIDGVIRAAIPLVRGE